ncbi:hypothetical protein MY5147_009793 [Beauveria neobassiana]
MSLTRTTSSRCGTFLESSHYKPCGPVIVIAGGEPSACSSPASTSGLLLVLEHRYYASSFPRAVADAAFFAQHARFPGLEDPGPDRGAHAMDHLRRLHPDAFWGAISSLGVTRAVYDYWEYNEAARLFARGDCGPAMANITIPWSAATPHRIGENAGRQSTTEQPFILIDPATHHWDEDDVPGEPVQAGVPRRSKIVDMHDQQVAFVKAWFNEFHDSKGGSA